MLTFIILFVAPLQGKLYTSWCMHRYQPVQYSVEVILKIRRCTNVIGSIGLAKINPFYLIKI